MGAPSQIPTSGRHITSPFPLPHHLSDGILGASFHVCLYHQTTSFENWNSVLFFFKAPVPQTVFGTD